jgi:hypothetical protein
MNDINTTLHANLNALPARQRTEVTAGILQLLAYSLEHYSAEKAGALIQQLAQCSIDWRKLDSQIIFDLRANYDEFYNIVKNTGIPDESVDDCIWNAFCIFLSGWQQGDEPSAKFFHDVLVGVATSLVAMAQQAVAQAKVAPQPIDLFQPGYVSRVYTPAKFSVDSAAELKTQVVHFMGELVGAKFSHEIRGLGFDNGTDSYHVLLETGELVAVPAKNSLSAAVSVEPDDYKNISPVLLLALQVTAKELELSAILNHEQFGLIDSGKLGKFKMPHTRAVSDMRSVAAIEEIFENQRSAGGSAGGITGPSGASVRFAVPNTPYVVVLDAYAGVSGPYMTSRLVLTDSDGNDTLLMRADTPRLFTARGVYLFPLPDRLISLTIVS